MIVATCFRGADPATDTWSVDVNGLFWMSPATNWSR